MGCEDEGVIFRYQDVLDVVNDVITTLARKQLIFRKM